MRSDILFPACIESHIELSDLAPELVVEDLLESFATLAVGKNQVVVLHRANRKRRLPAGVADDMSGERTVRIKADVSLPQNEVGRHAALNHAKILRAKVLGDVHRQDPAILVMIQDGLIRNGNRPLQQAAGQSDLLGGRKPRSCCPTSQGAREN